MIKRPSRAGRHRCAERLDRRRPVSVAVMALLVAIALSLAAAPANAAETPDRRCSPPSYGLWRIWNWHEDAVWQLTSARPRSLEVTNARPRPGPGALTIAIEVTGCTAGATPTVELSLGDGLGDVRSLPLAKVGSRLVGSTVVPDFGGSVKRVLATARLSSTVATGGAALQATARCKLTVTFAPGAQAIGDSSGANEATVVTPPASTQPAAGVLAPLGPAPVLPLPVIEVKRVTRKTSSRVEDRTYHSIWLWSFGDGIAYPDIDPKNVVSTQVHPFVTPGVYTVTAKSFSNKGTLLRALDWAVIVPPAPPGVPPVPLVRAFSAETVREPTVSLKIDGPHKWVVGRPADFAVTVDFTDPPHANRVSVLVDPGRMFTVVWDRPGRFTVRVAAVIHLRYEFPERAVSIVNTYVTQQDVEVFATVSTD